MRLVLYPLRLDPLPERHLLGQVRRVLRAGLPGSVGAYVRASVSVALV